MPLRYHGFLELGSKPSFLRWPVAYSTGMAPNGLRIFHFPSVAFKMKEKGSSGDFLLKPDKEGFRFWPSPFHVLTTSLSHH